MFAAGILLNTVVAFLVHAAGVVVLSVAFGVRLPGAVDASARVVFDVAVVVTVVAGLVVWALPASRRLLRPIVAMLRVVPGILRDRSRLVRVAGAAIGVNVAYAASLQASLAAFGSAPDPAHTMLVYLGCRHDRHGHPDAGRNRRHRARIGGRPDEDRRIAGPGRGRVACVSARHVLAAGHSGPRGAAPAAPPQSSLTPVRPSPAAEP